MPYPKHHKLQSKDRILKSAADLFARYGFEKVSIGQIMKLAQLTHGAFYAHFESKEALFKASFIETLKNSRAARLVKKPFAIGHLTALVTDYLSLRELKQAPISVPEAVLFNEIGTDNVEVKKLFEASYIQLKKMLERRIAALRRLEKLPFDKDQIADSARTIMASLVGAVTLAKSISQEEEQQKILHAAQKQILIMLGVNEAQVGHLLKDGCRT